MTFVFLFHTNQRKNWIPDHTMDLTNGLIFLATGKNHKFLCICLKSVVYCDSMEKTSKFHCKVLYSKKRLEISQKFIVWSYGFIWNNPMTKTQKFPFTCCLKCHVTMICRGYKTVSWNYLNNKKKQTKKRNKNKSSFNKWICYIIDLFFIASFVLYQLF